MCDFNGDDTATWVTGGRRAVYFPPRFLNYFFENFRQCISIITSSSDPPISELLHGEGSWAVR